VIKEFISGRLFNRLFKGLCLVSVLCISSLSVAVDTGNDGLGADFNSFAIEAFFASDLPESVRSGVSNTLRFADNKWGDYLSRPIEYWVLGADIEAANDLADIFCSRRLEAGDQGTWYNLSENNCNESMMYPNHRFGTVTMPQHWYTDHDTGWFEGYRRVGQQFIEDNQPAGSAGIGGVGREWNICFASSAIPTGFVLNHADDDQKVLLHEAFHCVQHSSDTETLVPDWFNEGVAEFMARRISYQGWASGDLEVLNENTVFFQHKFRLMMERTLEQRRNICPNISLSEIIYGDDCGLMYDITTWGIAYFLHKAGNPNALLDIFYPKLAILGWEGAFEATIGMSLDTFYAEFDTFLDLPLNDQLAILPIISRSKAEAGPNQGVRLASLVTLDGSDSESADIGTALTYSWSFISHPSGSTAIISNPTNVIASFTADIAGTYTVQLVVSDQEQASLADTVTFIAVDSVIPRAQVTDRLRLILAGEYNRPSEDAESWEVWSTDTPQAYKDRYFSAIEAVRGTLGNYKNWNLLAVSPEANDTVNAPVIQRFKELFPWYVTDEEYFGPVTTETLKGGGCLGGSYIEKFDSDGSLDISTSEFHSICSRPSAVEWWFPEELHENKFYEADHQLGIATAMFHEYFHHYQRAHGLWDMGDRYYDGTEAPRWWQEGIAGGASVYWWLRSNYMKLDFITDQARAKRVIETEIDELNTETFWWYSQRIQNSGTLVDRRGNPLDMSEAMNGSDCSGWLLDENTDIDAPVPNCDRMAVRMVPQFMAHKSSWQAVLRDMPADMHKYGFWGAVEIHTGLNEQQFYDEFNALMRSQDWRTIGINDSPEGWNIPAESIEETVDFLNIGYSTVEDLPVDTDNDGFVNSIDLDDDNDGVDDGDEVQNGTNPLMADTDGDGLDDNIDTFPLDATESVDTDFDGVGDNLDAFPNDATEAVDSDSDGTGDNSDAFPNNALYSTDSDSDGMPDEWETRYGLDPNNASDAMSDQDNDGVTALDEFLAGTIPSGSLDIDGNDQYDALTDGLLLLRGMFGLDGSALVTGTVASDATYTESVDIESRIATLGDLADIDGNGEIDALTDGLLTLRYLFGLQGDTLINGVVASDATRTSAEEIEAHLETLMPSR